MTTPVPIDVPEGQEQRIPFDYTNDPSAPDEVTFVFTAVAVDGYFVTVTVDTTETRYGFVYGGFIEFYDIPAKGHRLSVNFYKRKNTGQLTVQAS